jgi:hypothetical protein
MMKRYFFVFIFFFVGNIFCDGEFRNSDWNAEFAAMKNTIAQWVPLDKKYQEIMVQNKATTESNAKRIVGLDAVVDLLNQILGVK